MVQAALLRCTQCQARMHPTWPTCAVCHAPAPPPVTGPQAPSRPAVPLMYPAGNGVPPVPTPPPRAAVPPVETGKAVWRTPAALRHTVRVALGEGGTITRREDGYHYADPLQVLSPDVRRALGTDAQCQDVLEACYVLGPILPGCGVCGELRYWFDHDATTWRCWACVPPALRTAPVVEEMSQ